jgi:hypothetical protein
MIQVVAFNALSGEPVLQDIRNEPYAATPRQLKPARGCRFQFAVGRPPRFIAVPVQRPCYQLSSLSYCRERHRHAECCYECRSDLGLHQPPPVSKTDYALSDRYHSVCLVPK